MTVEDTFDILAEAADVRYATPERENKGLCPAHDDHNNPGLAFTISATTGNLLTHCFAQDCLPADVAAAIGVPLSAFFPGSSLKPGQVRPKVGWQYLNVLEVLKLMPLGYSWDEQIEAVFRTLDTDRDIDMLMLPYHEVPYHIMRDVYLYAWCLPHWEALNVVWWTYERDGYADQGMKMVRRLSQSNRTSDLDTLGGTG